MPIFLSDIKVVTRSAHSCLYSNSYFSVNMHVLFRETCDQFKHLPQYVLLIAALI